MPRKTLYDILHPWRFLQRTVLLLILLAPWGLTATASSWKTLAPGIEYQDIGSNILTPWSHVHTFRIDLKKNKLDLITAQDLDRSQASVDQFAHHAKALIAINGGFFDKAFQPLGLRIGHHVQYSPLKPISWWGVFYVQQQTPHLAGFADYHPNQTIDFAVQSGPRLLINGQIPPLKLGHAERTALGITRTGHLIIVITDHAPMTTTGLAHFMKSSPLFCRDALNLDGGSSTQLYAQLGDVQINAHGFSDVSDAIVVKPLKNNSQ
jgi:uncharacterized protein YigE (DUF2233 family)